MFKVDGNRSRYPKRVEKNSFLFNIKNMLGFKKKTNSPELYSLGLFSVFYLE